MDIRTLTTAELKAYLEETGGLFGASVNTITVSIGSTTNALTAQVFTLYESMYDEPCKKGEGVAGDNVASVNIDPSYFPVCTKGAECGALVTKVSWAHQNLAAFEWIQLETNLYFVTGILNSSQTDANDPFAAGEVDDAICWAGSYVPGLNPFA